MVWIPSFVVDGGVVIPAIPQARHHIVKFTRPRIALGMAHVLLAAEVLRLDGVDLGGGALTALTTVMKFGLMAFGLSAFWMGMWSGVVYAGSFVLIQLLHLTVATKQPAVTAPAMVAKLRDLRSREGVLRFVDEVAHLFRSQVAAILGNLALVVPVVALISAALWLTTGAPMLTPEKAHHVLASHQLLGPTLLFAALTGLLLFASSIIAGWVENWFVLHKLDSAIAYNPTITRRLGQRLALRCSHFMRTHVSGLAANISLGLMLGLVPAIAGFFGLELEVRHVTLVTGQLTAAVMALGWTVWLEPAFWSALAAMLRIPLTGQLEDDAGRARVTLSPFSPRSRSRLIRPALL